MAGNGNGCRSLSPKTREDWTKNLNNVLSTSHGREHFHRFLETTKLKDKLDTLIFWGKCDQYINTPRDERSNEMIRDIQQFAEDEDVNFNIGELRRLWAIDVNNHENTVEVLEQAKQSAFNSLCDIYILFCKHLVL
uniref:RGS domain-containing protein n=1 Tax=Timema tahoe TaxID=61484 RepID=A0A7R9INC3_9NEOP|nr:unnamed protein product [Timema tahoe]